MWRIAVRPPSTHGEFTLHPLSTGNAPADARYAAQYRADTGE